jgi:hypothetical protein
MLQTLKKRFQAGNNTGIGGMLIELQLQTGLSGHYVFEERQQKRIWATAKVRKIYCEEPRVLFDYLCSS